MFGLTSAGMSVSGRRVAWATILSIATWTPAVSLAQKPNEDASLFAHNFLDEAPVSTGSQEKTEALLAFYKGVRLQRIGNYTGAQTAFEEALALDSSNVTLANRLAHLSAALNEPQHGLQVLRGSLSQNSENPVAYINLAQFCVQLSKQRQKEAEESEDGEGEGEAAMLGVQALDVSLMAVERFPEFPAVYALPLELYLAQNAQDQAQAMLIKAIAREDANPVYWLEIARFAQRAWKLDEDENLKRVNGIYDKAIASSRALADDQNLAETLDQTADYLSQTHQYDRAVDLYRQAINKAPALLVTREKLGHILGVLDLHDEKLEVFEELVAIDPADARVQISIGDERLRRQDSEKAIGHYLAAIDAGESDPVFYEKVVRLMLDANQTASALPVLKRAHFLYPEATSIAFLLAKSYSEVGELDASLRAFKTLESDIEAAREEAESATTDNENGSAEDKDDPKREIAVLPELPQDFYFHYGNAAALAKRHVQAAHLFRKGIAAQSAEQEPGVIAKYQHAAGEALLAAGDRLAETSRLLSRAHQLAPENPNYLDALARCHHAKGETAKAIELLRRAVSLPEATEEMRQRLREFEAEGAGELPQ